MNTDIVYNADCIEGMRLIESNSVDFILTDPPFNVNLDYDKHEDSMNDNDYSDWCLKWISELYRILKENHYCVIFTGDKKLFYVMSAIYKTQFVYHHLLKWHKPQCQRALSGTVLFNITECAFVLSKGKPDISLINRKDLYSDTLTYPNVNENNFKDGIKFNHPAGRPSSLYRHIIKGFTREGDIVLDPFLGSGTTAISCKQTNRHYIGFEISEKYFKIINRRLSQEMLII